MAKKIHKLTDRENPDFDLIGIASAENDYRLSWALNRTCGFALKKMKDLEVFQKKLDDKQEFSQFQYYDESSLIFYRLISNRSEKGYLLGEMVNVDYILQVSGDLDPGLTDHLVVKLKSMEGITLAFRIDTSGLKSVQKLAL